MDTGKKDYRGKKDNNGAVRMGDAIGTTDAIAQLNALADASAPADEPRYDLEKVTRSMARRGFRFTPQTFELARKYCQGKGGFTLRGDVGVGKSFFFYALEIPALSLELAKSKSLDELDFALDSWRDYDIVIDDVGRGDETIVSYGTRCELLPYVMEKRMEACGDTFMTTNLTVDELMKRYGTRIVDRMTLAGKMYTLEGASQRRPGGRRLVGWYEEFFKGREWPVCARLCRYWDGEGRRCLKGVKHEPRTGRRDGYEEVPLCQYF